MCHQAFKLTFQVVDELGVNLIETRSTPASSHYSMHHTATFSSTRAVTKDSRQHIKKHNTRIRTRACSYTPVWRLPQIDRDISDSLIHLICPLLAMSICLWGLGFSSSRSEPCHWKSIGIDRSMWTHDSCPSLSTFHLRTENFPISLTPYIHRPCSF